MSRFVSTVCSARWFAPLVASLFFVGGLAATPCHAQNHKSLKFEFDYSEADGALFNDVVKAQIEAAGEFLASFIADTGTIQVKVVADPTTKAYASAATSEWAVNEDNKTMPKTAGIVFQVKSLREVSQKESGMFALVVHELGHVLGFTEACKAFASHTKDGMFSGDHVTKFHGGPVPVEGGHFPQDFQDKAKVEPRMCNGGGDTLSLLDLAVLADLGYNIPLVEQTESIIALGFKMPEGAASFDKESGGRILDGGQGNNTLIAHDGIWFLRGGPGDDILVSGTGETTMYGRNLRNAPGKDTFYIRNAGKKHVIENFGPEDVICLDPGFEVQDLEAFVKEKVQATKAPNGATYLGRYTIKLNDEIELNVILKDPKGAPLTPANFKVEAYKAPE